MIVICTGRDISECAAGFHGATRVRVDRIPRITSRHGKSHPSQPPQPLQTRSHVRPCPLPPSLPPSSQPTNNNHKFSFSRRHNTAGGTSTPSASLRSNGSVNSRSERRTTTGSQIWAKCAPCSTRTHTRSRISRSVPISNETIPGTQPSNPPPSRTSPTSTSSTRGSRTLCSRG